MERFAALCSFVVRSGRPLLGPLVGELGKKSGSYPKTLEQTVERRCSVVVHANTPSRYYSLVRSIVVEVPVVPKVGEQRAFAFGSFGVASVAIFAVVAQVVSIVAVAATAVTEVAAPRAALEPAAIVAGWVEMLQMGHVTSPS